MREDVFQRYSAFYDLLYRDKDYGAEADYIARTLWAANPNAERLLEFGSGTGRHGRLLAGRGFDVFGIERSESMVAAARATAETIRDHSGCNFQCVQGDIRSKKVDRTFDAVLALFHVVSYQTTDTEVIKTFSNASRHLQPGGIFFFDVWHGPAVLHERPSVREKHVEDDRTRLTRIAQPELDLDSNSVRVHYIMTAEPRIGNAVTTFEEDHRMRYFFPREIELFARNTGFTVERTEEFLTGKSPSDHTWGVAYLLRKRA